jgi:hypothetical protein
LLTGEMTPILERVTKRKQTVFSWFEILVGWFLILLPKVHLV